MFPVDPYEFGKGEESLLGLIFFLSVSKTRASSEAVVGVGPRVAFEFLKKESFLIESDGVLTMDPDLEVMGRCFNDHTSRFKGAIGMFVMSAKKAVRQIICQKIG